LAIEDQEENPLSIVNRSRRAGSIVNFQEALSAFRLLPTAYRRLPTALMIGALDVGALGIPLDPCRPVVVHAQDINRLAHELRVFDDLQSNELLDGLRDVRFPNLMGMGVSVCGHFFVKAQEGCQVPARAVPRTVVWMRSNGDLSRGRSAGHELPYQDYGRALLDANESDFQCGLSLDVFRVVSGKAVVHVLHGGRERRLHLLFEGSNSLFDGAGALQAVASNGEGVELDGFTGEIRPVSSRGCDEYVTHLADLTRRRRLIRAGASQHLLAVGSDEDPGRNLDHNDGRCSRAAQRKGEECKRQGQAPRTMRSGSTGPALVRPDPKAGDTVTDLVTRGNDVSHDGVTSFHFAGLHGLSQLTAYLPPQTCASALVHSLARQGRIGDKAGPAWEESPAWEEKTKAKGKEPALIGAKGQKAKRVAPERRQNLAQGARSCEGIKHRGAEAQRRSEKITCDVI